MNFEIVSDVDAQLIQHQISSDNNQNICTKFCTVEFLGYHTTRSGSKIKSSFLKGNAHGLDFVLPLSESKTDNGVIAVSHAGSPYAGLCINTDRADVIKEVYENFLNEYVGSNKRYQGVEIRLPPEAICPAIPSHEWALWSLGFNPNTIYLGRFFASHSSLNLNRNRKRRIDKIDQTNQRLKVKSTPELEDYELLVKNRKNRHDVLPTHNLDDFRIIEKALPGTIETYSISHANVLCSIAIVFNDKDFSTIQYLAGSDCSFECGSQDSLVMELVRTNEQKRVKTIFGTSTEPIGNHKNLNEGLDSYKASFGAKPYTASRYFLKL